MPTPTETPPREQTPQPPDERFWVKYSRHHELPISGLASLAWHTFGLVLIVLVAFVVSFNRTDDMPIETVAFPGGGGGNPLGAGAGAGGYVDAATPRALPKTVRSADKANPDQPLDVKPTDLFAGVTDDPEAVRQVAKITERGTNALDRLSKLDRGLRDMLAGEGQGGPGSGGGKGMGHGPGVGDDDGPGGKINARTKRRLRWTMMFTTSSGQDYLRQLHVLGAILALNTPEGDTKVVRNMMARPVKLEVADVGQLLRERIHWIDDKPDSVEQLMRAMGLRFVPERVGAFFPKELESLLLMKELAYQNKREDQIRETRFQILMGGGTKYEIVVVDQRLN